MQIAVGPLSQTEPGLQGRTAEAKRLKTSLSTTVYLGGVTVISDL